MNACIDAFTLIQTLTPRADKIAKEKTGKKKPGDPLGLPGVITMYTDSETGKSGVLDGQHRIGALKIMAEDAVWPQEQEVLLEVHAVNTATDAKELFTEINKAEPLKLIDMPDATTAYHRTMLASVANQLAKEFPAMFKPTTRCRAPHTNVDNLREELFLAEDMHQAQSPEAPLA